MQFETPKKEICSYTSLEGRKQGARCVAAVAKIWPYLQGQNVQRSVTNGRVAIEIF